MRTSVPFLLIAVLELASACTGSIESELESASLIIGSPDEFVKAIRKYQELGADEVWFRIDSLPHEMLMRSIELIGRYVLPQFREPWNVVEEPEVLRERIRARRAAAANGSRIEAEPSGPAVV